jgi:hypothetical protein
MLRLAQRIIPLACALVLAACNPKWTVTRIDARAGTVADVHGNTGLSALPAPCQSPTPPFPQLPDDWWTGLPAASKIGGGAVGYVVWKDDDPTHAPPTCPASSRTDAYRGFFEFDLSRYLPPAASQNMAGTIAKAVLNVRPQTFVQPVAPAATQCDPQYGAAFEVRRVPPAVSFQSGMRVNFIAQLGPPAFTNPPIPDGYPAGALVLGFPAKNPAADPNLTQTLEVDVTQAVVSTLQQNAAKMVFMLVGMVEPTFITAADGTRSLLIPSAPLPQQDCRSVFRLWLDVSTP